MIEGQPVRVNQTYPQMEKPFQRYTHTTTHDGTKTGRPWNKVKVQEPLGDGRYRVVVLMLHGVVLPEPFETIDSLAHVLNR